MKEYLTCILTLYTSSETKNSQANLTYIYRVIILLHVFCCFGNNMVLKSSGGKNCLRTLFPFLALGENIKNKTAQIGAKTAQIGAKMAQNDIKTAQNSGNHQKRWFFSKTIYFLPNGKKYRSFGKRQFLAHLGGIVIYTHSDGQKVRMPFFSKKNRRKDRMPDHAFGLECRDHIPKFYRSLQIMRVNMDKI